MIPPLKTIKKDTIGATYEHINRLIKDKNFDTQEYVKYNENLDVFEKKVQALIIDTFKLQEGVINCLLSNDPHLVRRVLKCDWFFEDSLTPKCYEEKIFPNVSISTRCKIINKLARNIKSEKDAEELFHFANVNYGSKYAELFLAKCSFQFISDYITECKPSFNHHDSEKNLINICKRFPDFAIPFFQSEMCKGCFRESIDRNSKLIKYLGKNYPLALMPILEKFHSEMHFFRFGKKSTKVLYSELMKLFEKIPPPSLMGRMNMSVIFKRLTYEEQINFLKSSVHHRGLGSSHPSIDSWPFALSNLKNFLTLKPANERARMVETVFFQLYNEKYLDHPEMWSLEFLELFPEDYRAHLVAIFEKTHGVKAVREMLHSRCKDHERDTKDTFIYLLGFKNAFPLLTELMRQMTTNSRREILLEEMIRNCVINEDPEGLESVMNYMSVRHKNEDPRVIFNIILYHVLASPKIINLNVWNLLEKMAALLLVSWNGSEVFGEVLERYIAFKLENNLDPQPQIKSFFKLIVVPSLRSTDFEVLVRNVKKSYSRTLIMLYYKEIFSGDSYYAAEGIRDKLALSLLLSVNEYNRTVRRNRINIEDLPLLVEGIDKIMKTVGSRKANDSPPAAVFDNKFLKRKYASFLLDYVMEPKTLRYLIKFHPSYIINGLDKIIAYMLEINRGGGLKKLFGSRCQVDFLKCMPKLERAVREKFKMSALSSEKVQALKTYSHIASLENFTELIKEYIPNEESFDFDSSKADFHEVQISIPGIIRNIKPVWKNLELVLMYLKKDFLRWALPSFFSVCHNSSVSAIIPVLRHRFTKKKDVTVKRVILCCILDLLSKVEGLKYCQLLWESEKHSSVRELVFQAISRIWREEQSKEIFDMVKKCIRDSDDRTINGRLDMGMVPVQFLGEYASTLWEFTEKYEGKRFIIACKNEIIHHFNASNISVLSEEFCQKVLKLYLFEPDAEIKVEDFCCNYVLYHSQAMDRKLSFVLELLRERKTNYGPIIYFINRLKDFTTTDPGPVFTIFETLLKEWPKVYGSSKMYKEYLLLNYMKGYSAAFNASHSENELFGAALGKEFRKIINSVPRYECFVEIIQRALSDFMFNLNLRHILEPVISNFLGDSFGEVEGIIAIHLIPWEVLNSFKMNVNDPEYKSLYNVKLREQYGNIFKKLLDKNNEVIKIYMNLVMDNALD